MCCAVHVVANDDRQSIVFDDDSRRRAGCSLTPPQAPPELRDPCPDYLTLADLDCCWAVTPRVPVVVLPRDASAADRR